ncbi:MAG: DUF3631 domain-containing protein [Actinomycetota bacterium]
MTDHTGDVDGADLLDELGAALARYVVLPTPEASVAVTLWIAATHAAPAWNTAPRLVIRGPEKRCGKSRLLDIIEATCHWPRMTVNATPSAIYRSIGLVPGDPPTILLDEADTVFGPAAGDHEDLRGILNAGHQRNRPALRYDAAARSVEEIETYAMAALAGIGRMPDTIEDRAVIIKMRRRAPHEVVSPYRLRRDGPPLRALKLQLHSWARHHLDDLARAEPEMPLEDRAADTWEALVALADQAGRHWPNLARAAAVALTGEVIEDDEDTVSIQLLRDCRRVFDGRTFVRTTELLEGLRADLEAPWASHGNAGLTPRTLAGMLREFGVRSTTQRIPGGTAKGYLASDFADTWTRYLPAASDPPDPPSAASQEIRNIRNIGNTPGQRLALVTDGDAGEPAVTDVEGTVEGGRS